MWLTGYHLWFHIFLLFRVRKATADSETNFDESESALFNRRMTGEDGASWMSVYISKAAKYVVIILQVLFVCLYERIWMCFNDGANVIIDWLRWTVSISAATTWAFLAPEYGCDGYLQNAEKHNITIAEW